MRNIFIVLLFSTTFAYGQIGFLKGKVIDNQTREPLIGANIQIDGTELGSVSGEDGNFLVNGISPGTYAVKISFISYKPQTLEHVVIRNNNITFIAIALDLNSVDLAGVSITRKANRESENVLLLDRKKSIMSVQSIGAAELSKKGVKDAELAVTSVAGIAKQEGVKNVFVRGLGDRYNITLLNGLPVPSEDPEYKNIDLSFFKTDIIKNIDIDRAFSAPKSSDVGGAIIDIKTKDLLNEYSFGLNVSTGFNNKAIGTRFKEATGLNYWGYAKTSKPPSGEFGFKNGPNPPPSNGYDFKNKLDPSIVNLPLDESYMLSGGKKFFIKSSALSFYVVGTHSSNYSHSQESIKNTTTDGTIYQEQSGRQYNMNKSQLLLGNINYNRAGFYSISYNFLMLHSANEYIGEYLGKNSEIFQNGTDYLGYLRRQQINDNRLFIHQLISNWRLTEDWDLDVKVSLNQIEGLEPDRRENYLSQKADGTYGFTGSDRQKRFFSALNDQSYNPQIILNYKFKNPFYEDYSKISIGSASQISNNRFEAVEYNFSAVPGHISIEDPKLDSFYNPENFDSDLFSMRQSGVSSYEVINNNHSAFITGNARLSKRLSGTIGFKYQSIHMKVGYDVPGQVGANWIQASLYLPSINLKYNFHEKSILRLGASKTYTLPQAKEISPYQYVNIGFTSEGNPNLKYSDNYNVDLKWDYYLSRSELISISTFYKRIINPIGRVDKGNSAGLLTYDNIGKTADVTGIELELRKDLFKINNSNPLVENKLSIGLNAAYIFASSKLDIINTPARNSGLGGASPFIVNSNLSYNLSKDKRDIRFSFILNYFSDRIFTIGTNGYENIVEKGLATFDFVSSYQFGQGFGMKIKALNISDPTFKLTRKVAGTTTNNALKRYQKGIDLSLGVFFKL